MPSPTRYASTNFSNLLHIATQWIKTKVGIPETAKFIEPTLEPDIVRKKDYIINILSKDRFIVDIDNFQNVDIVSFEVILEIIRQTNNTIFIFEYTLDQYNNEQLLSLYKELLRVCESIKPIQIELLDFDEAIRLVPRELTFKDKEILKKYYEESNGNLMDRLHLVGQKNCGQVQYK